MRGVILRCLGGFYYVMEEHEHECRAAGRFRKEDIKPIPGDIVEFSPQNGDELGFITDIDQRKNRLIRPEVANIDLLMIVVAASKPRCDYKLTDKLIASAKCAKIPCVLVINKCDERSGEDIAKAYKNAGIYIISASSLNGQGLEDIKEAMRGKLTALAGQSAVGKSSLINAICPGLELKTGGLSKKTARGKHTTRASELIKLPDMEGFVIDTPGFSVHGGVEVAPEDLRHLYSEFEDCPPCRFLSCVHDGEPECEVKAAVAAGIIDGGRYERYIEYLRQLQKETNYD